MSFSPSNIIRNELINVISSYITCYDCKNISTRVVDKSCSHLVCEKCSEAHSCNNSDPLQNSTLPPSFAFMNDLYDQLQKISSITSKSSSAIIPINEARMGRKSRKRRHQTKMTNGHIGENKSSPDKKTISFADPEAVVTRYLSNGVEPNQASNEMPVLEREDNQSQDYLDETQRPDKFDDTVNGTVNSIFDLTEDNKEVPSLPKKAKHQSTTNYIQRAENTSVSSLSSDDNCSVQESTSCRDLISTHSLPGPSKIRRIQEDHNGSNFFDKNTDEPKLIAFYEHELDISLMKLLRFKLVTSLLTSASIQSGNYEFTIRKVEISTPAEAKHASTNERSDDIYNQATPEASPERVHNLRDSSLPHVDDENSLTLNGEREIKPGQSCDKPTEEIRQSNNYSSGEEDPMENSLPIREADTHLNLSTTRESDKETKMSIRKKKKINKTKQKAAGITPLNKIILREENEELKKKEISKKREKKEGNVWLSTSGLSSQQQMHVIKLARLTKAKLSNCISLETTHFIVGEITEDNQDYLLAIAYGVNIVTIDWVTSCLAEGKIIDPTKFIHQADEGPAKCLEGTDKPFKGFYFFMGISPHPSHLDYATYQVTKTLCYHGGADIILDLDKFLPYSKFKKFHPRFFISISSDLSDEVKEMCVNLQAAPIMHTWIFSSMRQYRPVPIFDFMYNPLTIYDDISLKTIPSEILGSS